MNVAGSLLIIMAGIMMIIKPMKVWEFTNSKKTKKPQPTKYYLNMLRVGGFMLVAGGIAALSALL
jgi:hypothetical protein